MYRLIRCSDGCGRGLRVFQVKVFLSTLCSGKLLDKLRCEFLWNLGQMWYSIRAYLWRSIFRLFYGSRYIFPNFRRKWKLSYREVFRVSARGSGLASNGIGIAHIWLYWWFGIDDLRHFWWNYIHKCELLSRCNIRSWYILINVISPMLMLFVSDSCVLDTGPPCICWLAVLHSMAAISSVSHGVKCSICHVNDIQGFRYKCMQCTNFNMCQNCYWHGKTAGNHVATHDVKEYSSSVSFYARICVGGMISYGC